MVKNMTIVRKHPGYSTAKVACNTQCCTRSDLNCCGMVNVLFGCICCVCVCVCIRLFCVFPVVLQDILAPFVAEACLAVMPPLPAKPSLSVENVRVCKLLGGSAADSHVVRGMVVQRDAQVMDDNKQASIH